MSKDNWKSVAAMLAAKIDSGEFRPGQVIPSGDSLAKTLNINRNAVHRALEELQRQGLVIRRQGSGTVVADRERKGSGRIALLVDGYSTVHNFPSGDLLQGIQDCIGDEMTLMIADSRQDPSLEARQLRRLVKDADGILLYMCSPDQTAALSAIVSEGYPVVALDRIPRGLAVDAVTTDNKGTVESVVNLLIGEGHRKIGYMSLYKPTFSSVTERHEGYLSAMTKAGLDTEDLVRWLPEFAGVPIPVFERLVQDTILSMRQGENPITALICAEDCLGCAAVVACDRLCIGVPDDLEIASFIDWHPMTLHRPWDVRRIVQRKYDLGHAAAKLLKERIAKPGQPPRLIQIPADIDRIDTETLRARDLTVGNADKKLD